MINDIWSVAWKELMQTRRNMRSHTANYVFVFGIWGVLFPATSLNGLLQGELLTPMLTYAYLAVLLGSGQTLAAFVGERMQKTLGTLLTTRLSDTAIYLGKVLSIVITCYSVMFLVLGLHLTTIWFGIAMMGRNPYIPYSFQHFTFLLLLPICALIYTSSLGVYISLRLDSIRGQHLLNLFMGFPVIGAFYFILQSFSWFSLLLSILAFALVSVGIATFSISRFRRQTLILQ